MSKHPKEVVLDYTNWRGERKTYRVRPQHLAFEANEWHQEVQWLLHAMLVPSNELRTFALTNIHSWQPG
jgi:hypothetical protein